MHLHSPIRSTRMERLVEFAVESDVLLGEVIRVTGAGNE
jgi:hypothetical protein